MKHEDKQLLIKDLCARLPYSISGLHRGEDLPLNVMDNSGSYMVLGYNSWFNLDTVPFKPYLRPMDSMTADELIEYNKLDLLDYYNDGFEMPNFRCIDWLNAHHFDYSGLIEKGLAIEMPFKMYKEVGL